MHQILAAQMVLGEATCSRGARMESRQAAELEVLPRRKLQTLERLLSALDFGSVHCEQREPRPRGFGQSLRWRRFLGTPCCFAPGWST